LSNKSGPKGLYELNSKSEDPMNGLVRGAGALFFFSFVALWGSTEWLAARLGFSKSLGAPLVPRVYEPWAGLAWTFRYWQVREPQLHAVLVTYLEVLLAGAFVALALAALLTYRAFKKSGKHSDLHGSAHWATEEEIKKSGLLGAGQGVYVGAWEDGRGRRRYLRHDGPEHVLAFAPTRSGKGVGLVLPTLLSWPHSVLVHDIKGENYALTSGWRAGELGSRILKFDPANNDGSSCRFNPLLEVRLRTPFEIKDVQNIVQILTDPEGKAGQGEEAHWIATSSALLLGVILHVLYIERDKSLGGVAAFLSDPSFESPTQMYQHMLNAEHDPKLEQGWLDSSGEPTATHPVVAMAARDMLNKDPKEATSVLSTATRFLVLFRDPIVARNIAESDFKIRDLMNDDAPVSLYLIVPPSEMDRIKPLTRLIVNQILRTLTAEMAFADGRSVAGYKHRLLLMIDEFPSLGRLEIVQAALAFMAGYGIKAYLITQDVSQLAAAYGGASGRDETIMANCHVQIAYAPNKVETMELLSKLAGKTTVMSETKTYAGTRMSVRMHVTANVQETERDLLTPDEARRLPPDDSLIFVAGQSPIYGKKIKYYEDPTFSARAKIPPASGNGRDERPAAREAVGAAGGD
jgi:type IV secretion system protein VirD4